MFVWRWNWVNRKLWKKKKTFFSVFDWIGRKENKWWDPCIFSLDLPKTFLSKMKRKLNGDEFFLNWHKYPCEYSTSCLYFFFLFHCAPFSFFYSLGPSPFFFFFFLAVTLPFFFWILLLFFNKFEWLYFLFCGYLYFLF